MLLPYHTFITYPRVPTSKIKFPLFQVYNELYLDIVAHVKENVEESIKRLGDNGMKIHNLVIPKPKIPEDIKANYQAVKVQWTKQLVATQEQKTQKILKETENIKAKLDAER